MTSTVPFLDLRRQYDSIRPEVLQTLDDVCQTGRFAMGKAVFEFEQAFANRCGVAHSIGVNSGTSALHIALRCLDVAPGDEVITAPMTFIATAWAILYVGAKPVFVDVDPMTRTLDPTRLEAAITKRTKAIIPVHLYGQPADLDPILDIAESHGIPVVEDAAQAHGALHRGRPVGSIGRIGCFSFYPGKNLGAFGEAGAIVTNDSDIANRASSLRDHGQSSRHVHAEIGYNYRMDEFQGAVLNVKLQYLDEWTRERQRVADRYDQQLRLGSIELPSTTPWCERSYHLYVALLQQRDQVRSALQQAGIATGLHYPIPLHLQQALRFLDYRQGDFPVSERIAQSCLSLPMFPELTNDEVDYVAATLVEVVQHVT